ncbi:hypothetical protein BLA29_002112, partial [Euroglyphus maynei]
MANNVLYGYLAFHGKDSKVKYPIRKRKITIGSARDCDLRLKKEPSNRQFVQLSIKQSSQNGWDYKLDICACKSCRFRENITIDDQKVFLDSISIQLKDGNVISIFGENFTFLQGKRLTSKIPVLKKNQLLNLYSTNSCGWSSKSNAKNSPFRIGSANRSKIPISDTSKLIDFDHSPVVKLKESTVNNDMIDNDEIMTEIDHDQSSKHDETFEVDPEKSALLKFSTPSPQMKIVVAKSLKSLLKTTPQLSTTPNRKSVVFNEFVEENHSEYDRRTGQLFSTKKLSRKLFPISSPDHQQTLSEQDELDSFLQHFCDEIDSAIASSTMANNDSTLRFYTVNESIMADDDQSQSEHSTIIGHHYVDKEPDQHDTWYDVDLDAEKPDTPVKPVDDYTENSLQQQPTTPMAEHDSNVDDSLPQPTTPKADYVTNIDFAVKKLQQPTT